MKHKEKNLSRKRKRKSPSEAKLTKKSVTVPLEPTSIQKKDEFQCEETDSAPDFEDLPHDDEDFQYGEPFEFGKQEDDEIQKMECNSDDDILNVVPGILHTPQKIKVQSTITKFDALKAFSLNEVKQDLNDFATDSTILMTDNLINAMFANFASTYPQFLVIFHKECNWCLYFSNN